MKLLFHSQPCHRLFSVHTFGCLSDSIKGCLKLKGKSDTENVHQSLEPKKVVYLSNSKNIFENLALEEWLYENSDLTDTDYLLLWRNKPAIVVGRHQNPWLECDVPTAVKLGVDVVRRNSGGGTVYHDEGNLNLSFLMHRARYNRRRNLSQIVTALASFWDLDLELNCRDDLILDGVFKVSGTASKIGGQRTFHHFTLMFDVNRDILTNLLQTSVKLGVDCKATKSIPSPVKNLKEAAPDMTFERLVKLISNHFVSSDPDKEIANVEPLDECRFPGITTIQHRLRSFDWVYAKTPVFSVTRTFVKSFPSTAAHKVPPPQAPAQYSLRTHISVEKGKLRVVTMELSVKRSSAAPEVVVPFRLLDLIRPVGETVEAQTLEALWSRSGAVLKSLEGAEDHSLLSWGLACLQLCVPAGYGAVQER